MARSYSIPTHKDCTRCKVLKPVEAFSLCRKRSTHAPHWRSECKQCMALASKNYRSAHPERVRHTNKTYREKHKLQRNKTSSVWKNNHREHVSAYNRAWRQAHPTYDTIYCRLYPEKIALIVHRRRARKQGLPDTFTLEQEQFGRRYFHYACAYCGNEEGFQWKVVMDHFIPIASPSCPGTIATNMVPSCQGMGSCNNSKSARDPQEWLIARFGKRKAATILRKIDAYFAAVRARFSANLP